MRPRKPVDTSTYTGRFAVRLKMLREKAGLSVAELSEKTEIPKKTIFEWESDNRTPGIDRFPQLAKALKVKIADLLPKK